MTVTLNGRGAEVSLPESRLGQRRRMRLSATVCGQAEDGTTFEEKATLREVSLQGAYLFLKKRPRLQSELRVVIESAAEPNQPSAISLRATVVHCESLRGKEENGVGVFFIEDADSEPPRD